MKRPSIPNGRVASPGPAPRVLVIPIGLTATGTRTETDSMGAIDVPADKYWGAQIQRSLIHFSIGDDRMPKAVYHAYGHVKKAVAAVNGRAGRLPAWKAGVPERRRQPGPVVQRHLPDRDAHRRRAERPGVLAAIGAGTAFTRRSWPNVVSLRR
jgi:hypothetical protein